MLYCLEHKLFFRKSFHEAIGLLFSHTVCMICMAEHSFVQS
jgi:hypothetical protein